MPEDRGEACGERLRAERDEIAVEVVALGHDDQGGDARACAAPDEAFGRALAFGVVVASDDEARDAGRRREGAEAAGGERAAAATVSGIAVTSDSTVSMPSPTSSVPAAEVPPKRTAMTVHMSERLARGCDARLGGPVGIEPGAVYAADGAVTGACPRTGALLRVAGDGGDERRQAANAAAVAIEEARGGSAAPRSGSGGWRAP